jgi:hypothetical protein
MKLNLKLNKRSLENSLFAPVSSSTVELCPASGGSKQSTQTKATAYVLQVFSQTHLTMSRDEKQR